jgi:outer membrane lipoprotein-sorting protein
MHARWLVGAACAVAATAASADTKGDALLRKARATLTHTRSLKANLDVKAGSQALTGTVEALKPNLGRVTLNSPGNGEMQRISTGKEMFMVMPADKTYQKVGGGAGMERALGLLPNDPINLFFHPSDLAARSRTRYLGAKKVGGKAYDVVEVKSKEIPFTQQLYINAAGFPEGVVMTVPGAEKQTIRFWLKDVKLNAALTGAQFAYMPPADFTLPKGPEESLLPVGQAAPDFNLDQPGGQGLYSLESARKEKKAVLVNFWFYG